MNFVAATFYRQNLYDDFLIKIIRSKEAEISLRSKHKQKEKRERCKLVRIEIHVLIGCGLMAGNIDKIPIFTGLGGIWIL